MPKFLSKILTLFFIGAFSVQQAFSLPVYTDEIDSEYVKSKNSEKFQFVMPVFVDEAADSLPKELKKPKYISRNYVDIAFVNPVRISGKKKTYVPVMIRDLPVRFTQEDKFFEKPVFNNTFVFDDRIPVKVSPDVTIMSVNKTIKEVINGKTYYRLRESPLVGTCVKFKVKEDVFYNNKLFIKKNADVFAVVGRSVPAMAGGTAGELQIDRFRTFDVDGNVVKLFGCIENEGVFTGYFAYLAGLALAPFTFCTSVLLMYMLPGAAGAVKSDMVYTVYYLPEKT